MTKTAPDNRLWLYLIVCAVLLAPASAAVLWHANNQAWPTDDAATYMRTAYDHYLALKEGNLANGLQSLYWKRGWRPIAFPVLATPFLWLGGGNVLFAVAAVMVGCLLAWTLYAYLVARLYLPPLTAALAATFTCSIPALAGMAVVFYAELPWLAASTAFAFHALRSQDFRDRRHALAAGLALALAALLRPAETVVTLVLPAIVMIALALHRGTILRRDVIVAALLITVAGGVLVAAAFVPRVDHQAIWPLCGLLLLAAIEAARRSQSPGGQGLSFLTATFLIATAFWYADFMPRLYAWIHATSFGAMAGITDARVASIGFLGFLRWLYDFHVGPQAVIVALTALLALSLDRMRPQAVGTGTRRPWMLATIALSALLPMIVLYSWTGTSDPRRVMAGVSFAALTFAVIGLSAGALYRLRIAIVSIVVGAQVLAFVASARMDTRMLGHLSPLVRNQFPAPRATDDPHPVLIRNLLDAGIPRGSMVAAYTMGLHQGGARVWEPFAAMVAAGAAGDPLWITYRWEVGDYESALDLYRRLGVEYVLVEHFRDQDSRNIRQPYVSFTMALLDRIEAGETHPPGLQLLARFEVGGRLNSVFRILP